MNLHLFMTALSDLLTPMVLAACGWGGIRLGKLVRTHARCEERRALTARLEHEAGIVVRCLENLAPRELQWPERKGPLSLQLKQSLRTAALAQLKGALGPAALVELASSSGWELEDIDQLLAGYIEAAVYDLHQGRAHMASSPQKTPFAHEEKHP